MNDELKPKEERWIIEEMSMEDMDTTIPELVLKVAVAKYGNTRRNDVVLRLPLADGKFQQLQALLQESTTKARLAQIAKDEFKIWRKDKEAELAMFKAEIEAECKEKKEELMRNLGLKEEEMPYLSDPC